MDILHYQPSWRFVIITTKRMAVVELKLLKREGRGEGSEGVREKAEKERESVQK